MGPDANPVASGWFATRWRRFWLSLLLTTVGAVLSFYAYWLLAVGEEQLAFVYFERDAEIRVEAIQHAALNRLSMVRVLAAFFAGSQLVDRQEFKTFTAPLLHEYGDIQALGWVPRVPAAGRRRHEEAIRNEGFPDYEITDRDPNGRIVRAGPRDEYCPILYVEPFDKNRSLLGFGVRSSPTCRAAIEKALTTGRPVAECPSNNHGNTGQYLLCIIESAMNERSDAADRPAGQPAIDGFVFGEFQLDDLVKTALATFPKSDIRVSVVVTPIRGERPLYLGTLKVADQQWSVACWPSAGYLAQWRTRWPLGVLATGLMLSALLASHFYLLTGRTAQVERLVAERTRALQETEGELRREQRLLRDVLDIQERDRKLVAFEIHDGLAQQLTGALYKFQAVEPLQPSDPVTARQAFQDAIDLLREAITEVRRLIGGLRPPVLDASGVVAAIDYLIAEHRERPCPEIEFLHADNPERLAPPLEGALFRIAQECLTNACRYSKSHKIRVELGRKGDRILIEVRDWGVGFDPAKVESGHVGLRGIRERAELLGGVARIESSPGKGARIHVELPALPPLES